MKLNDETLRLYAAKYYTNAHCADVKEFLDDLQRATLAKKLIKKWRGGDKINVRLLVNHIIMFTNVFEISAAKKILLHVAGDEYKSAMKTILLYLNFIAQGEMPEIKYDLAMAKMLRELTK